MTAFEDPASQWNERYSSNDYVFGRDPNAYLSAQAHRIAAGGKVLCVADGEGRNSVWLARQGLVVQAFDVSDIGVSKARRLAADARVAIDFTVCDCDAWPWSEGSHDAVVAVFVQFADPPMRERLFANMVRALRPGGLLVLQGYTPRQLAYKTGGPSEPSHLYTAEMLRDAFRALQIIDLVDYETELDEGTRHVGRSALIGLVARRP